MSGAETYAIECPFCGAKRQAQNPRPGKNPSRILPEGIPANILMKAMGFFEETQAECRGEGCGARFRILWVYDW